MSRGDRTVIIFFFLFLRVGHLRNIRGPIRAIVSSRSMFFDGVQQLIRRLVLIIIKKKHQFDIKHSERAGQRVPLRRAPNFFPWALSHPPLEGNRM